MFTMRDFKSDTKHLYCIHLVIERPYIAKPRHTFAIILPDRVACPKFGHPNHTRNFRITHLTQSF